VHGEPVKVPVPLLPNETVPVGVIAAPTSLSVTVAVQVVDWPMRIVDGRHTTDVDVDLLLTVTLAAVVVLLVACVESPL
jgi:hypothetical protein